MKLRPILALSALLAFSATAASAREGIGHDVGQVARGVGHGFKDGARGVGHAFRDGAKDVGHAFKGGDGGGRRRRR
jgi:hypothetical protein